MTVARYVTAPRMVPGSRRRRREPIPRTRANIDRLTVTTATFDVIAARPSRDAVVEIRRTARRWRLTDGAADGGRAGPDEVDSGLVPQGVREIWRRSASAGPRLPARTGAQLHLDPAKSRSPGRGVLPTMSGRRGSGSHRATAARSAGAPLRDMTRSAIRKRHEAARTDHRLWAGRSPRRAGQPGRAKDLVMRWSGHSATKPGAG